MDDKQNLDALLSSIYVKPEEPTAEDKIYDALAIAYTKNLLEYMREQRDKYKAIEAKLKELNNDKQRRKHNPTYRVQET